MVDVGLLRLGSNLHKPPYECFDEIWGRERSIVVTN